jgi:hypothetical protein
MPRELLDAESQRHWQRSEAHVSSTPSRHGRRAAWSVELRRVNRAQTPPEELQSHRADAPISLGAVRVG